MVFVGGLVLFCFNYLSLLPQLSFLDINLLTYIQGAVSHGEAVSRGSRNSINEGKTKKKKKSGKWNAKIEAIFAIFKWKSQISCDMVPHF